MCINNQQKSDDNREGKRESKGRRGHIYVTLLRCLFIGRWQIAITARITQRERYISKTQTCDGYHHIWSTNFLYSLNIELVATFPMLLSKITYITFEFTYITFEHFRILMENIISRKTHLDKTKKKEKLSQNDRKKLVTKTFLNHKLKRK